VRSFFDPSAPVLTPAGLVCAFTGKRPEDLLLPPRAVIVFTQGDLHLLVQRTDAHPIAEWRPLRRLYRQGRSDAVLARSSLGGPALAALVEELAAFGVREFCLCGYCGAIAHDISVGDIVLATSAKREDGVSRHYLADDDPVIGSEWASAWEPPAREAAFFAGRVWTSDALYRETAAKVARYGDEGVLAVEMETASLYAVCAQKGLKAVAFLVVSDIVRPGAWLSGLKSGELRSGARRLADFVTANVLG
jgi:uridine phosphorylase